MKYKFFFGLVAAAFLIGFAMIAMTPVSTAQAQSRMVILDESSIGRVGDCVILRDTTYLHEYIVCRAYSGGIDIERIK
jgi:hypothetical protein